MTTPNPAIRVEGLIKRYGKTIALRGLELTVASRLPGRLLSDHPSLF